MTDPLLEPKDRLVHKLCIWLWSQILNIYIEIAAATTLALGFKAIISRDLLSILVNQLGVNLIDDRDILPPIKRKKFCKHSKMGGDYWIFRLIDRPFISFISTKRRHLIELRCNSHLNQLKWTRIWWLQSKQINANAPKYGSIACVFAYVTNKKM